MIVRLTGVSSVADLARRHEEADGSAVRIGCGVELCVHAALGAPDQSPEGAVSLTLKVLHLEGFKPLVEKAFYEAAIV